MSAYSSCSPWTIKKVKMHWQWMTVSLHVDSIVHDRWILLVVYTSTRWLSIAWLHDRQNKRLQIRDWRDKYGREPKHAVRECANCLQAVRYLTKCHWNYRGTTRETHRSSRSKIVILSRSTVRKGIARRETTIIHKLTWRPQKYAVLFTRVLPYPFVLYPNHFKDFSLW